MHSSMQLVNLQPSTWAHPHLDVPPERDPPNTRPTTPAALGESRLGKGRPGLRTAAEKMAGTVHETCKIP